MRLAYLTDIHGNSIALQAVLAEIDAAHVDLIFCGGDLVGYGPFPNEVIALVRRRKIPLIMGNYDEGVGFDLPDCGCVYRDPTEADLGHQSLAWTQREVTPDNQAYLRELLGKVELAVGGKRLLLVHGSPRRINEYLFADRPEESLARLFTTEKADLILCGHTHLPYVRRIGDLMLINAGSVGKPKDGDPRAGYALVEMAEGAIRAEIRRVDYDVEQAAQAVLAAGLPSEFAAALRKAR